MVTSITRWAVLVAVLAVVATACAKDDLDPLVGGIWGVAGFFSEADGAITCI